MGVDASDASHACLGVDASRCFPRMPSVSLSPILVLYKGTAGQTLHQKTQGFLHPNRGASPKKEALHWRFAKKGGRFTGASLAISTKQRAIPQRKPTDLKGHVQGFSTDFHVRVLWQPYQRTSWKGVARRWARVGGLGREGGQTSRRFSTWLSQRGRNSP